MNANDKFIASSAHVDGVAAKGVEVSVCESLLADFDFDVASMLRQKTTPPPP